MSISGVVDYRLRTFVTLSVRGPSGREEPVQFWLDTGFNGTLILPADIVARLGLREIAAETVVLADGQRHKLSVFRAVVLWDGQERETRVLVSGTQPLLGTSLPLGHRITIDMVDGGSITIVPLSGSQTS